MLKKVSSALLLSDVKTFADRYTDIAALAGVSMKVEKEWGILYRMDSDVVIYGSKYFDKMSETYYPVSVIILHDGESPEPYMAKGVSRFIFNHRNGYELLCALYKEEAVIVHASGNSMGIDLGEGSSDFCFGDYDFRFKENVFRYRGKPIYLTNAGRSFLAEWLLHGNKENSRRMLLFHMRKKFGDGFLRDVDRHGRIKEKKDGEEAGGDGLPLL